MSDDKPFVVDDLATFCQLVEQDRVGVGWTVYSDIGPEWIGSRRELTFYVDGRPASNNATISRLGDLLIEGLQIPATSSDFVIYGEGDLRKNGSAIEVIYYWYKTIPYDYPVKGGSGVFTLVQTDDS
jgi:hypothetical protein